MSFSKNITNQLFLHVANMNFISLQHSAHGKLQPVTVAPDGWGNLAADERPGTGTKKNLHPKQPAEKMSFKSRELLADSGEKESVAEGEKESVAGFAGDTDTVFALVKTTKSQPQKPAVSILRDKYSNIIRTVERQHVQSSFSVTPNINQQKFDQGPQFDFDRQQFVLERNNKQSIIVNAQQLQRFMEHNGMKQFDSSRHDPHNIMFKIPAFDLV